MISGEVVLLIIITLINLLLWFIFFVRFKRSFSPQVLLSEIKNEVDKLLIEINKTALEDVTIIEERTNGLRALIDEADKRMKLLQGLEKGKKRQEDVLNRLSKKNTTNTAQKVLESYKKMSNVEGEKDYSDSVQLSIDFEPYRDINDVVVEKTEEEDLGNDKIEIIHVEQSPLDDIPFKERVLQLASKDFSSEYIANKLGCTITEVQLVIDLYSL